MLHRGLHDGEAERGGGPVPAASLLPSPVLRFLLRRHGNRERTASPRLFASLLISSASGQLGGDIVLGRGFSRRPR